jgi:hypothetical protein
MAHQLRLRSTFNRTPTHWNPEEVLAAALAERDSFLSGHPEYVSLQHEIDALLEKAGNSENRMTVLAVLMEAKLIELHEQLKKLNTILLSVDATRVQCSEFRVQGKGVRI